jgi:hypothetical protein
MLLADVGKRKETPLLLAMCAQGVCTRPPLVIKPQVRPQVLVNRAEQMKNYIRIMRFLLPYLENKERFPRRRRRRMIQAASRWQFKSLL